VSFKKTGCLFSWSFC